MTQEIQRTPQGYRAAAWWRKLIRFSFRLLYNELAWSYDAVSWVVSLGEWRKWQRAALPFLDGRRLLEIGHGPGHMLAALAGAGFTVIGLDLSPAMARLARRRTAVPLVRGRVQSLPFAADSFDAVLATFPTEFIVDPDTLTTVRHVLRPHGRFVVVPEGHLTGKGPLYQLIEWLFAITGQRSGPFAAGESALTPLLDLFDAAGFDAAAHSVRLARSEVTVVVATARPW